MNSNQKENLLLWIKRCKEGNEQVASSKKDKELIAFFFKPNVNNIRGILTKKKGSFFIALFLDKHKYYDRERKKLGYWEAKDIYTTLSYLLDMKEKISITLDENIIKELDNIVDGVKVKNRSHAIEVLLSRTLGSNRPKIALFLLGGEGTRFRPITYEVPKALLPIQGKTVPEHLFELFKKYGIKKFIFSLNYKAEKVKEYFGNGSKWGVEIIYIVEDKPMGSAGAIKLAREYLKDGPFIITNGDELKDIDIEDMYNFHKENKAKITVALTTVVDPSAYGVAALKGNKILKFVEKPKKEEAPSNLINSGLSIWEPSVLDKIPEGFSMYEKDVFPLFAEHGELFGYIFEGQWFDTGTPERYEKAIKEWKGLK